MATINTPVIDGYAALDLLIVAGVAACAVWFLAKWRRTRDYLGSERHTFGSGSFKFSLPWAPASAAVSGNSEEPLAAISIG
jgi:hypothetical protein